MRYSAAAAVLSTLLTPCITIAADAAQIDQAKARGIAALRKLQKEDGRLDYYNFAAPSTGATALAGLALLECGVKKEDPTVQKAASYVRSQVPALRYTYSISLSIMFLDHLDDPADEPLITSLTARLVAGQCTNGAWDYDCPDPAPAEEFFHMLNRYDADKSAPPAGGNDEENRIARFFAAVRTLRGQANVNSSKGDNSVSQFATLALWVARRKPHNLPVDESLKALCRYLIATQTPYGWRYSERSGTLVPQNSIAGATSPMTCAGLQGLAIADGLIELDRNKRLERQKPADAEGNRNKKKPGAGDSNPFAGETKTVERCIDIGLRALARDIGLPVQRLPNAIAREGNTSGGFPTDLGPGGQAYYLLWGIERVATTYGLRTIGNKDWYEWGSDIVVATQHPDGSWAGAYAGGGVDTSFALLFLSKGNLAGDLATMLRGRIHDPGEAVLRAGGSSDPLSSGRGPGGSLGPRPELADPADGKPGLPGLGTSPGDKLAKALLDRSPAQQLAEIERLRDQKGTDNTVALAIAIHYLPTDLRRKARDALVDRLTRMKAETIADYLQDEESEIRRAAALACAGKGAKQLVPQMIPLLSDSEALVARAALTALRELTGQDFGPTANAGEAERKRAVEAWNNWWKKSSR